MSDLIAVYCCTQCNTKRVVEAVSAGRLQRMLTAAQPSCTWVGWQCGQPDGHSVSLPIAKEMEDNSIAPGGQQRMDWRDSVWSSRIIGSMGSRRLKELPLPYYHREKLAYKLESWLASIDDIFKRRAIV